MKKYGIAAVLSAVLMLLTACSSGSSETNLAALFPDEFRYCFGDGASFAFRESRTGPDGETYDKWNLAYTDADGQEHAAECQIARRRTEEGKPSPYYTDLCWLVEDEMEQVLTDGLAGKVLMPARVRLNQNMIASSLNFESVDGASVSGYAAGRWVSIEGFASFSSADEEKLGCAFQPCDTDVQTVAQNPFFVLCVEITGKNGITKRQSEICCEKAEEIARRYAEYAGAPQNYYISFDAPDETASVRIMQMLGEPYTGECKYYSEFMETLRQRLEERYK